MNDLKKQNPVLKTLLATGGWNAGSKPFSDMVETRSNRSEFVTSTIEFLRQRDFDGLDMDWEYPAKRGGRPEDRARLVLLLEVHTIFVCCYYNQVDAEQAIPRFTAARHIELRWRTDQTQTRLLILKPKRISCLVQFRTW